MHAAVAGKHKYFINEIDILLAVVDTNVSYS
jgi:hypothetical protein